MACRISVDPGLVEEVVEMRNGQKSITERKFFLGYVLVEMEMNDDDQTSSSSSRRSLVLSWHRQQADADRREVDKIMQQMG